MFTGPVDRTGWSLFLLACSQLFTVSVSPVIMLLLPYTAEITPIAAAAAAAATADWSDADTSIVVAAPASWWLSLLPSGPWDNTKNGD